MQLNIGKCTLCYIHTIKFSVAVHVSACSTFCFSATEEPVHRATELACRFVWCDINIMLRSWYVCLSCEEGT